MTDSRWAWLRRERYLYLVVVLFAALTSVWVQVGVADLRRSTELRDKQLTEFQALHAQLSEISADQATLRADEFARRLAAQDWHIDLVGVRPHVVASGNGLVVQLAPTMPAASDAEGKAR